MQEGGVGIGLQGDGGIHAVDAYLVHHRQQSGHKAGIEADLFRHLDPQGADPLTHGGESRHSLLHLGQRQQGRILMKTLQQAVHHLALGRQRIAKLVAARAEETGRHAALPLQLMGQLRRLLHHRQRDQGPAQLLFDPITFIDVPAGEKQQGQQRQTDHQHHLVCQSQLLHRPLPPWLTSPIISTGVSKWSSCRPMAADKGQGHAFLP